jgi:bacteriorhodopsin
MTVVSALFALLSWNVAVQRRIFYVLSTLTTIISALAYFAMACGQTSYFNCASVRDHHKHVPDTHHDVCRQVFWARYVDWALSTPLLVVELSLLAGIDGAHTIMAVIANVVLAGAFSAVGHANTAQKWGWYAISVIAFVFTVWHVAVPGQRTARARGTKVSRLFGSLSIATLILWIVYIV